MNSNILFIVVDSLRADKFYGKNKSSVTPNIDKMIKKGSFFLNTISSADVTGICLGNMFTGMFSQKTGIIQRNYNSNIKSLFDILKENNFHVYATIPNLTWFNQLSEKFDDVDHYFSANRVQDGLSNKVGKLICERLNSNKMLEPWIYYIHLEDLHEKIVVPTKYDIEKYGDTKYERAVSYIDEWIGKIISYCDLEKTLVVVTSDHGDYIPVIEQMGQIPRIQSFMKKGKEVAPIFEPIGLKLFIMIRNITKFIQKRKLERQLTSEEIRTLSGRGKKTLHDETLKIPLLIIGEKIPSKIFNNLVSGIDIFPTILNYLGIKIDNENIDGRDLNVLMKGGEMEEIPIFIQTGDTQEQKDSLMVGIRTSKFKYYRSRKNPKQDVFLYNLEDDPLEKNNIVNLFPKVINSMEGILEKYEKNNPIIKIENNEKTKEIEDELKKMGYV